MDGRIERLQVEYLESARRTAELKVQIDLATGKVPHHGIPHYTQIELAAREAGAEVSRQTQQRHLGELTARHVGGARCPTCEQRCDLKRVRRMVTAADGPLELTELKGHCPSCRRDFFPAPGTTGV